VFFSMGSSSSRKSNMAAIIIGVVAAVAITTILLAFLCYVVNRRRRCPDAHVTYESQEVFRGNPASPTSLSMYRPVPFTEESSLPPSLPESPAFGYVDPYQRASERVAHDLYAGYETPSSSNTSPGFATFESRHSGVPPTTLTTTTTSTTQTNQAMATRKGSRPLVVQEPTTSIVQHVDAGPSGAVEELPPAYSHLR
jgi:FlaG/FlaF family flagellin (archaellin)